MRALKVPPLEWDFCIDMQGCRSLWREVMWLLRHGRWVACRNTRPLIFGLCRIWYDGPHWGLHLGWWSISVSAW